MVADLLLTSILLVPLLLGSVVRRGNLVHPSIQLGWRTMGLSLLDNASVKIKTRAHFFHLDKNIRSKVSRYKAKHYVSDGGFSRGTVTIPGIVDHMEAKKQSEKRDQLIRDLSMVPTV